MGLFQFEPLEERDPVHHIDRIRWTEESFLDIPEQESNNPSSFIGVFTKQHRITVFFVCITVFFAVLFFRLFSLQLLSGASYAAIAEKNRIRVVPERARRGLIVDNKERPLVVNKAEFLLTVTQVELPKKEEEQRALLERVSRILQESSLAIAEDVSALPHDPLLQRQSLSFREGIDYTTAMRLLVEEERLPGFHLESREQRAYPDTYLSDGQNKDMPKSVAHIVGYLGKLSNDEIVVRQKQGYLASDLVGKDGLERSYDASLHGTHGKRFVEIDALGRSLGVLRYEAPQTGKQLTLSVDLDLQATLEQSLERVMGILPKRERRGAVAIAMDPRNGLIRALVSLPAYDPRIFSTKGAGERITQLFQDPTQPLFFRAIEGEYPSGSTIKPLFALAALSEGVITQGTTFLSTGGISVGPWFFPDWKAGGHGVTDVRRAIAESINTFFYIIGGGYGNTVGLGTTRIEAWLKKFHFGSALGIDLPNEAHGFVPTPEWKKEKRGEQWYIGDTYHLSIGQGDLLVTPLQIAEMTSFFANGGTLWQPQLVAGTPPVQIASDIASVSDVQVVREGMRRTITAGSAQSLASLPVAVAGKTGTAQWSSTHEPHAWFTGFAPYDNPELVVTVLIEEGGEGSATAVPVAREAFQEYFSKR